jgi:hypothetical protein
VSSNGKAYQESQKSRVSENRRKDGHGKARSVLRGEDEKSEVEMIGDEDGSVGRPCALGQIVSEEKPNEAAN